uniref:Uncharacterized protein n=1 Tax=Oryza nivara TaxID=4536 RepID=A0A0E0FJW1_ORYNI
MIIECNKKLRFREGEGEVETCSQNAETGTSWSCSCFQTRRTASVPPCIPTTAPDVIHRGRAGGLPVDSIYNPNNVIMRGGAERRKSGGECVVGSLGCAPSSGSSDRFSSSWVDVGSGGGCEGIAYGVGDGFDSLIDRGMRKGHIACDTVLEGTGGKIRTVEVEIRQSIYLKEELKTREKSNQKGQPKWSNLVSIQPFNILNQTTSITKPPSCKRSARERITWTFAAVYSPATRFSCIASEAAVDAMKALTATPFRRRGAPAAAAATATLEREKTPTLPKLTAQNNTPIEEREPPNPKGAHVWIPLPGPDEETGGGGGGEREEAGGPTGGGGEEAAEEEAQVARWRRRPEEGPHRRRAARFDVRACVAGLSLPLAFAAAVVVRVKREGEGRGRWGLGVAASRRQAKSKSASNRGKKSSGGQNQLQNKL